MGRPPGSIMSVSQCIFIMIGLVTFVAGQQQLGLPTFKSKSTYLNVPENTPVGTTIGSLRLENGDNLQITSSSSYVRTHQSNSGTENGVNFVEVDIILNIELDRDHELAQYTLGFEGANSAYQHIPFSMILLVEDVNDETPALQNQPYSVSVPENETTNTVVYTDVTATDPDTKETLTYTMTTNAQGADDEYKNKFSINKDNGEITLKGQLDFETLRFYQYTITVTDAVGHQDSADVFITIEDIQDSPPYFTGEPFLKTIQEDTATGQEILTVKAADGDRGVPNSVVLSIVQGSETCPGIFEISPTGAVSLKSAADRDAGDVLKQNGVCTLQIKATEGSEHPQPSGNSPDTATTDVTITVTDINDNGPEFLASTYSATVDENTQVGVPITMMAPIQVRDLDQAENAVMEISITNYSEYFEVTPALVQSTGDIFIRVKNSTILDYEKHHSLEIKLEINDTKSTINSDRTSSATVTLNINNMNDNSPVFTGSSFSGSVLEKSPLGTSVVTIVATDLDEGHFGEVSYSLEGSDTSFKINNQTGEVQAAVGNLDREIKDLYYLTVVAQDGGGIKVSTRLEIKILDVNDNAPEFVTDDYQTSLKEEDTSFSRSIKVHATDKDEPNKPNSAVQYRIVSSVPLGLESYFSMDATSGTLSVAHPLEYESVVFPQHQEGQIKLIVEAMDNGKPPMSSNVTIVINLQDVNNKSPSCNQSKYSAVVPENLGKTAPVVKVAASDNDGTAPNNVIMYSIDQTYADKFIMNSSTGWLSLRDSLDREVLDHYDITVTVTDFGVPALTGTCLVSVNVTDINDSPPHFSQKSQSMFFPENTNGLEIDSPAQDEDLDSNLSYSISWPDSSATDPSGQPADIDILKQWLNIDSQTGKITNTQHLDREQVEHFSLTLTVSDTKSVTGPQQDTAIITVTVNDTNDEKPTFSENSYQADIVEDAIDGSEIQFKNSKYLLVQDKDDVPNNQFSVDMGNYKEYFTVQADTSKGLFRITVTNSSILDYETNQMLQLQVIAAETQTPEAYKNTASVTLSIINKNDNMPVFINAPFKASVAENKPSGTSFYKIQAHDDDLAPYGNLLYSLPDKPTGFIINETTGEVYTNTIFDRETQDSYSLSVEVRDSGNFRSGTQLTVEIDDINDECPEFRSKTFTTDIAENEPDFIPALKVEAFDKDAEGTPNSEILYSILSTPAGLGSNFTIDRNTSEITLTSPLDYESLNAALKGTITLVVQAEDQGTPSCSSTTSVTITVKDVNDFDPRFTKSTYTFHVPENTMPASSTTTPSPADYSTTDQPPTLPSHHDFHCNSASMDLFIPIDIVPNSQLSMRDPTCQLQNNGTHHVISFAYDECGTSVAFFADHLDIQNEITVHSTLQGSGPVVFDTSDYTIPLQCSIPRNQHVDGAFQAVTRDPNTEIHARGAAYSDFVLREFSTALFQDEITEYPAKVPMNREVYIEIAVDSSRLGNTGVYVQSCVASPAAHNGSATYMLIQDGCPANPTVRLHPRPGMDRFRFSIQAFHFSGPENQNNTVYIHCDVSICPVSTCDVNCTGSARRRRRRRSVVTLGEVVTLISGPFVIMP